ncbi:MAG: hypothetical protein NTY66_04280 [Candidatus Vogelbacteria bacterium]|nr:hypothetical protein [Candidatus Vogelbacteria bacterium]
MYKKITFAVIALSVISFLAFAGFSSPLARQNKNNSIGAVGNIGDLGGNSQGDTGGNTNTNSSSNSGINVIGGSSRGLTASSTQQTIQQILAEIERRVIAISIEVARLSAGLPPNWQGGAYPGVEDTGASVPGGNIGTVNTNNIRVISGGNAGQGLNLGGNSNANLPGGSSGQSGSGGNLGSNQNSGQGGAGGSAGAAGGGGSGSSSNKPFGGLSTTVVTCTCRWDTPRSWITLKPAKSDLPSQVIFEDSSSILYEFKQIKSPGQQLLGTVSENTTCRMQVYWYCITVATVPKIYMVGTSGGSGTAQGQQPPPDGPINQEDNEPPASTSTPSVPPDQCKRMGNSAYVYQSWGTGYYPDNSAMEGGFFDMRGAKLQTLQDFLDGKASFVSVAMDKGAFPYGTELCIPELEKKYGRQIIFKVVDTGGAFTGKGTAKIDVCTRNQRYSLEMPPNGRLTLVAGRASAK